MFKSAKLITFVLLGSFLLIGNACSKNDATTTTAKNIQQGPSEALAALIKVAEQQDKKAYMQGITQNFAAVIREYEKLGETRPELKGAYSIEVFMRALARNPPEPKEERVQGNKAIIRGVFKDGSPVHTTMTLEEGRWKLEVPPKMVTMLSHFDELKDMAMDKIPTAKIPLPTEAQGKADRMKNLKKDAPQIEKDKAIALDAFDLGDYKGAAPRLEELLKTFKKDQEIHLALGRIYVKNNQAKKAILLWTDFLKRDQKAHIIWHYLGMAFVMDNNPLKAKEAWLKVKVLNSSYAQKHHLDDRIKVVDTMLAEKK